MVSVSSCVIDVSIVLIEFPLLTMIKITNILYGLIKFTIYDFSYDHVI